MRMLSYAAAIREAMDQSMQADPGVMLLGLGVPDPKGVFGTSVGLQEKYGPERVMDIPLAENALTGVAIGAALAGCRPIFSHQRVDFALVACEQMLNQAAKWRFMFGDRMRVPLVIRMIIGRGWGQGPQHSQSLQALFAHIPGLKVVMPSTAYDAKGLLIAAIQDDDPVIFLEHRWLHDVPDHVPEEYYTVPLGEARVLREGTDVTLVAVSHMAIEALRAADLLAARGIRAEVLDLRSIRPLDRSRICASVQKTGHLVVADTSWSAFGIGAEVLAVVAEAEETLLRARPRRLGLVDTPVPTSPALAMRHYPRAPQLAAAALETLGRAVDAELLAPLPPGTWGDQPDKSFRGPF